MKALPVPFISYVVVVYLVLYETSKSNQKKHKRTIPHLKDCACSFPLEAGGGKKFEGVEEISQIYNLIIFIFGIYAYARQLVHECECI